MAISYQPHCGDLAPHTLTQLSTSWCCSNFSICYRMDYTLPVDQQGQHLEHQPRQSQGHQQALNQVHQKAIDTFNGLVCYHIAQLCLHEAPAQLMCLSHPSLLQLPLSSHSAPTLLSCTIKMQLLHRLVTQWLKPSEEVIACSSSGAARLARWEIQVHVICTVHDQDSYTRDRAWRLAHILRMRLEYAAKNQLQLAAFLGPHYL